MLSCSRASPRADLPRRVAHALGGIGNSTNTNSLEAWQANYARGCRLFEVDLRITSDGKLVAFHGPNNPVLDQTFSHLDFLEQRVEGKYTPLDADRIAALLEEKRDWTLVTDTKGDLERSLKILCASLENRGLHCRDRVIPQIYEPAADLEIVEAIGFPRTIFTLYRSRLEDSEIVRTARSNRRIVAVTMPPARATREMVASLSAAGVLSYVHTVNGLEAIRRVFDRQIWGVYTDWNCGDPLPPGQSSSPPARSRSSGSPDRPLKRTQE
jgi:glycerophosphoryl diester phosphodiesterase